MRLHFKLLAVPFLCLFCTASLQAASAPSQFSELKALLDGRGSLESRLEFLKTALHGQSLEVKAALGAVVIQSSPTKEVASEVAQLLVQDTASNTPKLAGLLVGKLPSNLARSLAGSIAIGAGKSDPKRLPQITATVLVAQTATAENAGAIAEEVFAYAPASMASSIASAIGMAFADNPKLVQQAPQIAAGITRALLAKGPDPQIRRELAESIAALTVLLPGSVRSNHDMITEIGKAVAAVIARTRTGLATTIVAVTSATLKAAAGSTNIEPVLVSFRDAFRDAIDDPIIQEKLLTVVSEINAGTSDKNIKPLEGQPAKPDTMENPLPSSLIDTTPGMGQTGGHSQNGGFDFGPLIPSETNVINN